jgi:hypothetical protein
MDAAGYGMRFARRAPLMLEHISAVISTRKLARHPRA